MSQATIYHDVLTLDEAASFLRIPPARAEELASRGAIPGRQLDNEWRFLRAAIEEWLRGSGYRQSLLNQAGALKDDESLPAIRASIYTERGRPEVGPTEEG